MKKTQIQLPDELYKRAKAFSKEREWSLAETFRRAAEQFMDRYPSEPAPIDKEWSPPTPLQLGWNGLSAEELHRLAIDDMDAKLPN